MNKKVLWISLASVATLGVAGFFVWRAVKKKKANKALEGHAEDAEYKEVEGTEEVQAGASGEPQQPQEPPHIDIEENVVYLSAKWCPACQQNKDTADKLYAKYGDKVEFIMLDADDEEAKSYGFQLQIRHIPTLAFVNNGEKIDELVGPQTMEQYEEKMAKYFPQLFKKKAKMVAANPAPPAPPVEQEPKLEAVKEEPNSKALPAAPQDNHKSNGKVKKADEAVEEVGEDA